MRSSFRLASPAVLAVLALALAAPTAAQVSTLRPVDQGAEDPSFLTFRGRLLAALAARDTTAVLAAFSPEARLSFGDAAAGPEGVRQLWLGRDAPRGRQSLWVMLARVLGMGSTREAEGLFVSAPYLYAAWPEGIDPFTHGAVVGENVRVRGGPSRDGEPLTTLTYAVVPMRATLDANDRPTEWAQVTLGDGRTGYVSTEYLWSPLDYRAGFEKQGGSWRIVFFVAGD